MATLIGFPAVSLSKAFEDRLALLLVAEERALECVVVSKRRDAPLPLREVQRLAQRLRGVMKPTGNDGDCLKNKRDRCRRTCPPTQQGGCYAVFGSLRDSITL